MRTVSMQCKYQCTVTKSAIYSKTQCPMQPAWTSAVKKIRFSVNGLNIFYPLNSTDFSPKISFTILNQK